MTSTAVEDKSRDVDDDKESDEDEEESIMLKMLWSDYMDYVNGVIESEA